MAVRRWGTSRAAAAVPLAGLAASRAALAERADRRKTLVVRDESGDEHRRPSVAAGSHRPEGPGKGAGSGADPRGRARLFTARSSTSRTNA